MVLTVFVWGIFVCLYHLFAKARGCGSLIADTVSLQQLTENYLKHCENLILSQMYGFKKINMVSTDPQELGP